MKKLFLRIFQSFQERAQETSKIRSNESTHIDANI